ncbi:MAG: DEAD/DEAH box helicase [Halobacteriovoraceae bacterium]|jgi:ATP-dependent DNA helicase RecQ|nr:DEAD/DEAH box helicase [Halobacteriovoraceae bacterium]MBT5092850.1 DEAD/DEAH box helicase [Halobacteriovoraceae bacterium]
MHELIPKLSPATATLLLAPPAWGKTSMLLELFQQKSARLLFVSPLRALAAETRDRFRAQSGVFYLESGVDPLPQWRQFLQSQQGVMIATPEKIPQTVICQLAALEDKPIIIWDEFHLVFSWGWDFRPLLWERYMGLANSGCTFLGMSATMTNQNLENFRQHSLQAFDSMTVINLGNLKFKNEPSEYHFFGSGQKRILERVFIAHAEVTVGTILYFCRTRREVAEWLEWSQYRGLKAIGAVGGEVDSFRAQLALNPKPQVIFATSVLGHGVNLPTVAKVFISYKVASLDFWLQMASRGGRRGETFILYSMNSHGLKRWQAYWQRFKKTLTAGMMERPQAIRICKRCKEKLKAYCFLKRPTKNAI